MTIYTLINRKITDQDNIHVSQLLNRGFLLGEGVFTTCLVRKNQILFAREHFDRLQKSALVFGLYFNEDGLYEAIHRLIEQHDLHEEWVRLRITLSRTQSAAGLRAKGDEVPMEIIQVCSYEPQQKPLHLMCNPSYSSYPLCMNGIKHLGYQNSIIVLNQAVQSGFDDAIMFGVSGFVACSTTANIFFKIKNEWVTPPLSEGIVPGIIRHKILKTGLVNERTLSADDVTRCSACFITNSLQGCRSVARINQQSLNFSDPDIFNFNKYIDYLFC